MTAYNIAVICFTFGTFFLSLLVLLNRKDKIAFHYFLFSVFVSVWGIGYSVLTNAYATYEEALFGARLANGSAILIPVTWLHFILSFCGKFDRHKKVLFVLYFLSFLLLIMSPTRFYISDVAYNLLPGFTWYAQGGILFSGLTLLFAFGVSYGFVILMKTFFESSGEVRLQLRTFIFGAILGFLGGSFTFGPVYGVLVPQYGILFMPFYPFIMAYAMIRHRLFDVEAMVTAFQREKLATIGLLASGINHEIRNPLYIIKTILEGEQSRALEGLPIKSGDEISKKLIPHVHRIQHVIQRLNYFAKPAPEGVQQNIGGSVKVAVNLVLDLIAYEFSLDNILIETKIDRGLPRVAMPHRQLEEVLFNLIVNACHAMPHGGRLTISVERQRRALAVAIHDTGSGISREHVRHIFEPFYSTKGKKGTGLGLFITKQIIEQAGGKIGVESHPETGTEFYLILPILSSSD